MNKIKILTKLKKAPGKSAMPSTVKTNCKDEEKNIKIFLIKIYIYYLQ
jgi:hypothetical protein